MEFQNDNINTSEQYEINSWDDLNIDNKLLRGIYSAGYETPSPIQKKSIIHFSRKKDIIAQAQSGTGKTAAFSIGALQQTDTNNNNTQVLILSPTRELTSQTGDTIIKLGEFIENLRVQKVFGGTPQEETNVFLNKNTYQKELLHNLQ